MTANVHKTRFLESLRARALACLVIFLSCVTAEASYLPVTGSNIGIGTSSPVGGLVIMNGNVGVGTWSPTQRLQVIGNVSVTDEVYGGAWDGSSNVPTKNAVYDQVQSLIVGGAGGWTDGGTNVFTSTTTDLVAIGTTTPISTLTVKGNVGIGTTTPYTTIAAPLNGMVVEGNVGIGTWDPKAKLQVVGTVDTTTMKAGMGVVGSPSYSFSGDTDTGIYSSGADTLGITTGGTQRLRVDSTQVTLYEPIIANLINSGSGPNTVTDFELTNSGSVGNFYGDRIAVNASFANASNQYWGIISTVDLYATSQNLYGGQFNAYRSLGPLGGANQLTGIRIQTADSGDAGAADILAMNGAVIDVQKGGFGGGPEMNAVNATMTMSANGTMVDLTGIKVNGTFGGSGNITNYYGIRVTDVVDTSSGAISNSYNLYLGTIQGANRFSIYSKDAAAPSYFAGNLGIGTYNPGNKLVVNGGVGIGTTNSSSFINTSAPSGGLIVENNVGIGTTTPVGALTVMNGNVGIGTWSPTARLQVIGTVNATAFVGDGSGLTGLPAGGGWTDGGSNVYTSTTTDNVGIGTTTPSSTFEIVKTAAGTAPFMVSTTAAADGDLLLIASDGNVGVGTIAPLGAFTVMNGNVGIGTWKPSSALSVKGVIEVPGATDDAILFTDNKAAAEAYMAGAGTGNVSLFGVQGASKYPVVGAYDWSGSAGFHGIVQTGSFTSFYGFTYTNPFTQTVTPNTGMVVGDTTLNLWVGADPFAKLDYSGNFGIGTGNPGGPSMNAKLDLTSNGTSDGIVIDNVAANGDPFIKFELSNTGIFTMGVDDSDNDKFKIGTMAIDTSTMFTMETGGNIGIGTTTPVGGFTVMNGNAGIGTWSPTAKLQVIGNVSVTDEVYGGAWDGSTNVPTKNAVYDQVQSLIVGGAGGWTDGGTNVYTSTTTDLVAIGTTTPVSTLTVKGNVGIGTTTPYTTIAAPANGMIVEGNVGIGTFAASSGKLVVMGGNVGIGAITPSAKLAVASTQTSTSSIDTASLDLIVNLASGQAANIRNKGLDIEISGQTSNGSAIGDLIGIEAYVGVDVGSMNVSEVLGGRFYADNNSGAAVTSAVAVTGSSGMFNSSGSVVDQIAFDANVEGSAGTVTNQYGLRVSDLEQTGTLVLQNRYGLFMNSFTGTVTADDYGVFQAGSGQRNYFAGNVGVGTFAVSGGKFIVSGGNVGIGTTSASVALLNVNGETYIAGPVGIGTFTPTGMLDIRQDEVRIWTGAGTSTNATAAGELYAEGDLEVDGTIYGDGSGITALPSTLPAGGWTDSGTNVYTSTETDNVGIGTTTPGSRLEIAGENAISYPTPGLIRGTVHITPSTGTDDNSSSLTFGANSGGSLLRSAQAGIYVQSSNAYGTRMHFATTDSYATGSQVRMIINESGNIGIGTTIPSVALLNVNGETYIAGPVGIGTFTPTGMMDIRQDEVRIWTGAGTSTNATAAGELYVEDDLEVDGTIYGDGSGITALPSGLPAGGWTDGGTNVYTSTTTDNVGIGTTTPSSTLEIVKTAAGTAPLMVSTTSTSDGDLFLITSSGNVSIGTVSPRSALNILSGNVGIGTTDARALLEVKGNDFLVSGTHTGIASVPVAGAGTRMFFDTQMSAFRAGNVSGTQWDNVGIGTYSVAMGYNTTASGNSSTAMGSITIASGSNSTAMGGFTTASGGNSTAMGNNTIASGSYSTTTGFNTNASGLISTAMGNTTIARGSYSTAMGWNTIASGSVSTAMGFAVTAGNGTAGSGLGDGSMALGLIDDAVTISTNSQVTGIQSFGIFMGDQDGLVVSANNQMSLLGGKLVIDPAVPATNLTADTALEVAGTIKIGDGGESCDASRAGGIRYSGGAMQSCDGGGTWVNMGGSSGWTDGGTNVYTSTTTDLVAIGTTTPISTLTVKGNVGIGTTTPYTTIAAPLNGMVVEGKVGIGTWSPSSNLQVAGKVVTAASTNSTGGSALESTLTQVQDGFGGAVSSAIKGTTNYFGAQPGGTVVGGDFNTNSSNTSGGSNLYGVRSTVLETGVGSLWSQIAGLYTDIVVSNDTAAVLYGVYSRIRNSTTRNNGTGGYFEYSSNGGVTTDGYGIRGVVTQSGGTITNAFGVYAGTIQGTNKWSFYASDPTAPSFFSGNVGVGTTAPVGALAVMNGNVGIGTWSPTQRLQVVGTVAATAFVGDGSGLTGLPAGGGWTDGGTNVYTSTTTDNVGIGTTTPVSALTVRGNVGIGTTALYRTIAPPSGGMIVEGNVGIGSSTPTQKLDVNGNVAINGNIYGPETDTYIEVTGGSINLQGNNRTVIYGGKSVDFWVDIGDPAEAATGLVSIYNKTYFADNVGIGTDMTSAQARLAVLGGNVGIGTISPVAGLAVMNGNVGIGTWSPTQRLQVVGTVSATAFVGDGSGLTGLPAGGGWTDGGANVYNTATTDLVAIGTTTPVSTLTVKGNVGIGTTTPYTTIAAPANGMIVEGNVGIGTFDASSGKLVVMGGNVSLGTIIPSARLHVFGTNVTSGNAPTLFAVSGGDTSGGAFNTGGGISMRAGSSTASGIGGSVALVAGNGYNFGGDTIIRSGLGTENGIGGGGDLTLESGGGASIGGEVNLSSGTYVGQSYGGNVNITAAGGLFNGGNINISAGAAGVDISGSVNINAAVGGTTAGKINLGSTNAANITIASGGGNVGIGTTSPTVALLNVNGETYIAGPVGIGTFTPTGMMDIRQDEVRIWTGAGTSTNATAAGELYVEGDLEVDGTIYGDGSGITALPSGLPAGGWTDGGTNVYTSTTTDLVAIGTTTPVSTLTVKGNVGIGTTTPYTTIAAPANGMIVEGNVGIGTWSPTQRLQVVGTVAATAFVGDGSGLTGLPAGGGWTDGGTNVYTSTTADLVAIGTTTPASTLTVKGNFGIGTTTPYTTIAAPANGAIIEGNVGIGTFDPSNSKLMIMGGGVGIGTIPGTNYLLRKNFSLNIDTSNSYYGDSTTINYSPSAANSSSVIGMDANSYYTGFSPSTGAVYGVKAYGVNLSGTSLTNAYGGYFEGVSDFGSPVTNLYGIETKARTLNGSGFVYGLKSAVVKTSGSSGNTLYGVYSDVINQSGNGTVTESYGGFFRVNNSTASSNTTKGYGLYSDISSSAGSVLEGYGVYVGAIQANSKYSVYASDAAAYSFFAGNVGVGTITPFNQFVVNGGVGIGTLSSSTFINSLAPSGGMIVEGRVGVGTTTPVGALAVMNGNVGIGTWSPTQRLQVIGTVSATAFVGDGSGLTGLPTGGGWTDGGTNVYTTTTTDKVGIGTTTPNAATLEIVKNAAQPILKVSSTPVGSGDYFFVASDGNVGISTATAGQKLVVNGDANINGLTVGHGGGNVVSNVAYGINALLGNVAGDLNVAVGNSALDVNDGGTSNVAVGVASMTNAVNTSNNVAIGKSSLQDLTSGDRNVALGAFAGMSLQTGTNNIYIGYGIDPALNASNSLNIGDLLYGNLTTGNLGLGTAQPASRLVVRGGVGIGTIATSPYIATTTPNGGLVVESSVGIGTTRPVGGLAVMNGNVGIGTWSPTQRLQVVGTVAATAFVGDGSGLTGLPAGGGWTDGGTNVYTSTTTDNVGIGTTTPTSTLEIVKTAAQPTLKISSTATGSGDYLVINSEGNVGVGTIAPRGALVVMNGNVGLGTTAPRELLEVVGNISLPNTSPTAGALKQAGIAILHTYSSNSFFAGSSAGNFTMSGVNNTAVGFESLRDLTSGLNNTSMGDRSGTHVTIGERNAFFGQSAGYQTIDGNDNSFFGRNAGEANTSGSSNSFFGRQAGYLNLTGQQNTYIGMNAGYSDGVVTTPNNLTNATAIGYNSQVTVSNSMVLGGVGAFAVNVGIGTYIPGSKLVVNGGVSIGTTSSSAFIGTAAPSGGLIVENNVGIGTVTPVGGLVVMNGNAGIGTWSPTQRLQVVGTVSATAFVGDGSGLTGLPAGGGWTDGGTNVYTSTTTDSVGIGTTTPATTLDMAGALSMREMTAPSISPADQGRIYFDATANEFKVSQNNGAYTDLVLAGATNGATDYSTFLGVGVGTALTSGTYNTFIGNSAGIAVNTGAFNTAVGADALKLATNTGANTAVGHAAMLNSPGGNNTAVGAGAMTLSTTGEYNTTIGANSLVNVSGDANVAVGDFTMRFTTSGSSNTAVGQAAGSSNLTGSNNVFVGAGSGAASVGTANVFIGYQAGYNEPGSNKLYIANSNTNRPLIYGDFSTRRVGIGTIDPTSKLVVNGGVGIGTTSSSAFINTAAPSGGLIVENNVGIGTTTPVAGLAVMNGNVGIGTWSPTQRLQVIGTVNATAFVGDGSGLTGLPAGGGWTDGGTNVYTSTTTDNVGIGTTTPTSTLEIVKTAAGTAPLMVSTTAAGDGNMMIVTSSGNVGIGTAAPVAGLAVMSGNVGIGTWSPTSLFEVVGGGDSSFLSNVGIGTASPAYTLEVIGTGRFSNAVNTPKISNLTSNGFVKTSGGNGTLSVDTATYTTASMNAGYIQRATSTTAIGDSALFQSGTNIGIGTTTPVGALTVINGNVGIGTWSPTGALEVKGAAAGQVTINGASGGCLMFRDTDNAGWTECFALNGVLTCSLDADGICDGS